MALDDDVNELNLKQTSELEGVAEQLFNDSKAKDGLSSIDMRTNLEDEEVGLCLINDMIFKMIGMEELSPTRQFKRLASSRQGWKTEKFVNTAQGVNDRKAGGGFMDNMKSAFGRRE